GIARQGRGWWDLRRSRIGGAPSPLPLPRGRGRTIIDSRRFSFWVSTPGSLAGVEGEDRRSHSPFRDGVSGAGTRGEVTGAFAQEENCREPTIVRPLPLGRGRGEGAPSKHPRGSPGMAGLAAVGEDG